VILCDTHHLCRANGLPCLVYVQQNEVSMNKIFYKKLLVAGLSSRNSRFDPRVFLVGFVLDKVVLQQVIIEYFGLPL
jgi:hypothetical protein